MSWNGNDNKDPWGRNDTPPEIDEVIKKVRERIDSIFEVALSGDSSGGGFGLKNLLSFWAFYPLMGRCWNLSGGTS